MRLTPLLAAIVLASMPCAGPTLAQDAAQASAATPADARVLVAEVRRIIAERYVLPERRPALDAVLAEGLANGRYDAAQNWAKERDKVAAAWSIAWLLTKDDCRDHSITRVACNISECDRSMPRLRAVRRLTTSS